ncbi:hypothetical protein LTR86_005025 [Recurvomyces mirabilis]|nr:hypothetical protein LTR86_005025 [Recurvomyces mirabilis]
MAERKHYLKISFFLKKQPHLTDEQFHQHWKGPHADIALRNKTFVAKTRKYNQVHITPALKQQAATFGAPVAEYDGIAEVWVDSMEDWMEVASDPEFAKDVGADEALFILAPIQVQLSYDHLVIPEKARL